MCGLIEGRLEGKDVEGTVLKIPPQDMAFFINKYANATDDGYDRVITTYLSKKGRKVTNTETLSRFMSLVENLNPEIKIQLLKRAASHPLMSGNEIGELLSGVNPDEIERMINIFQSQSILPESLRNVLDKLSDTVGSRNGGLEFFAGGLNIIDDIEINEDMIKLFEEDKFGDFVDEKYQKELDDMFKTKFIGS
jgi:hypothetical protein